MNKYDVKNTHKAITGRFIDYLNTAYLGKNDALRSACKNELESKGMIFQEPFIEANNAYKTIDDGITNADIPTIIKKILQMMSEKNLGVFKNPYKHQIDALVNFYAGKDILVSTGTGSGKTECFMWPLVSKLIMEQVEHPETWNTRGIRAVILYPMNALVSDQMGRLRKMIGDEKGDFRDLEKKIAPGARIPQFGMYTSRTPYSGPRNEKKDQQYASTIRNQLLNQSDDVKKKLHELGKYPAKINLEAFCQALENKQENVTNEWDPELITRHEMQQHCPDILITNYSMLEYMLMRPIEKNIWENTQKWLASSSINKLLFIIDEAHMYRGSSGGEVALQIRRVMHRLGVKRDKIQFILTSASVPQREKEVYQFACDLTGQDTANNTFIVIRGECEDINRNGRELDPQILRDFPIDDLQKDEEIRTKTIRKFGELAGFDECSNYGNEKCIENWMYENLQHTLPMIRIMRETRGHATRFDLLAQKVFPNVDRAIAENAISTLLALAPFAKNKEGNVLYPARLHMMFRGITGIYACINPACTCKNHDGTLEVGHIYLHKPKNRCSCGGVIYELLNERTCGALFIRGYIDLSDGVEPYVWSDRGIKATASMREVHFYIIPQDGSYRRRKDINIVGINVITGRIHNCLSNGESGRNYLQVAFCSYPKKDDTGIWSFKTCPKCEKRNFRATDFSVKGNEPFFNLISEQFYAQPPVLRYNNLANGGRKVLLFSDSRQRAAILARDLTKAADEEAMKKALTVAAKELQEWAEENEETPTLNLLYIFFLKVACEHNLNFFYSNNEKELYEDKEKFFELLNSGRRIRYAKMAKREFDDHPNQYSEHLLRQLCSSFRSLTDVGLCWLEPYDIYDTYDIKDLNNDLEKNGIKMSLEEYKEIFASWAMEIMTSDYAVGENISNAIRRKITPYSQRMGLEAKEILPAKIIKLLKLKSYSDTQISSIEKQLKKYLKTGANDGSTTLFLDMDKVVLHYGVEHDWYKCPRCSSVFPFTISGNCVHCISGKPKLMSEYEFEGLSFWREPVLKAIDGEKDSLITRINTEEHTAQLSHKEQRMETWSTTEDFEMRFQNVHVDNDRPVDILSCTTTMEVGIDIGSLTAVGLRNIPPMRENYQQRAGRAGRRSAAISTIVTYTDNRPHDSYYFYHPEKIISGEPRIPWIDVNNCKLIYRHYNILLFTDFFYKIDEDIDKYGIDKFYKLQYNKFIKFIKSINEDDFDSKVLIPQKVDFDFLKYKVSIIEALNVLRKKIKEFPDNYKKAIQKEEDSFKSVLDVMLENGIFPSYSFPKDVVGFYIEKNRGREIEQKPERSLDMAISEYAPGRIIVVNKDTYKSGGIYNFHSKFMKDGKEHPARAYFNSKDYFKLMYYCTNPACNWMGLEHVNKCPFCGERNIQEHYLLKPWGFSPVAGRKQIELNDNAELSYAESPCYSLTPREDEMVSVHGFGNLRYSLRADDPLLILNMGPQAKGFMVCKDCGAAVAGDDIDEIRKVRYRPYEHPHSKLPCKHVDVENVYLGNQFRTDMIVYEIALDDQLINTDPDGLWLERAGQTLAEAMVLAAGRLLDIEFSELKSGYRVRRADMQARTFVDVFLFDSLSSGAGYSSRLASLSTELINETRTELNSCPAQCESACHECLKHYGNQRVHQLLDRFAALELLNWCENSSLPSELSYKEQSKLLMPLNALEGTYRIKIVGEELFVENNKKRKSIIVYPSMWNRKNGILPSNCVAIPDKVLKYALPMADEMVRRQLN